MFFEAQTSQVSGLVAMLTSEVSVTSKWYDNCLCDNMNVKRIFGAILTLAGIGSLIYAAVVFMNTGGGTRDVKSLIIFGVLGLLFFASGIGLLRSTQDKPA